MDRAEERAAPEDVGEQALMRGLDTAFPFVRLRLSRSRIGHRSDDRPLSVLREFLCRGPALITARLFMSSVHCLFDPLAVLFDLISIATAGLWAG
jgi:hypothetical protein